MVSRIKMIVNFKLTLERVFMKQINDVSTCFYRSSSRIGRLWLDPDTGGPLWIVIRDTNCPPPPHLQQDPSQASIWDKLQTTNTWPRHVEAGRNVAHSFRKTCSKLSFKFTINDCDIVSVLYFTIINLTSPSLINVSRPLWMSRSKILRWCFSGMIACIIAASLWKQMQWLISSGM